MAAPIDDEDVQRLLERLAAGDPAAADELVAHSVDRFRLLARRSLRQWPGVRQREFTDDVLQGVALRLRAALPQVRPDTVPEFVRLAGRQIRRELADLHRHHFGRDRRPPAAADTADAADRPTPVEPRRPPQVPLEADPEGGLTGPGTVLQRGEVHELAGRLPEDERAVVELLFYQGLSRPQAARQLGVSEATVKRRFRDARLRLYRLLTGEAPPDAESE